jgi:hypothetical protein
MSRRQIIRLEEEASARSARTQRSIRSSRGRLRAGCVYGVPYGIAGKRHLIEYRDDTIKHATSPSRRDCSQQVVISRVFQIQSIATKHKKSFSRLAAASFSPFVIARPLTRPLASPSRDCCCLYVFLLFKASEATMPHLRNFDTKPPSSYCYEFRCDNRLESVANAHTAADLHVRPVP